MNIACFFLPIPLYFNFRNRDFSNVITYKGHNNFVSSVCVLPPCESHPKGLILTASNDKTILGYNIDDPVPVLILKGHENTVCSVATGHIPGMILRFLTKHSTRSSMH